MKNRLKIAFIQSDIRWEDIENNLEYHYKLISGINEPVDIIVLPEMFTTGFTLHAAEMAVEMTSTTIDWMKNVSLKYSSVLAASVIIKENNQYFNRFLWIQPDGKLFFYDKKHLFRMGGEHKHYSSGLKHTNIEYKGWRIRLFVCYDLRFPVWCRNKNEYDLAIFVANWPDPRAEAWKTLLSARAMENQSYVLGVNRCGIDGMKLNYSGDSRLINSYGKIISEASPYKEEVKIAEIYLDSLNEHRKIFPVHLDADDFRII